MYDGPGVKEKIKKSDHPSGRVVFVATLTN